MRKLNFKNIIKNLDQYDFSEFIYKNNYTKSIVFCKKHNIKSEKNLKQIRKGNICPLCLDKITSTKKFIQKSKKIWGNKWDYSKTKYNNSRTPLTIGCFKHNHHFNVYPSQHLKKQKDCIECQREIQQINFIDNSRKIWGDEWDYSKLKYINNKTEVELICKQHGSFFQRPDNHLYNKNACPKCNQSKGENIISKFLDDNEIVYETQKKFNGCEYKYLLRFDFYLPKYNICIEYNGQQHYDPIEYFGGDETLKYNIKKDSIKKKFCEKNKIDLITVKYNENVNKTLKLIYNFIYNK